MDDLQVGRDHGMSQRSDPFRNLEQFILADKTSTNVHDG